MCCAEKKLLVHPEFKSYLRHCIRQVHGALLLSLLHGTTSNKFTYAMRCKILFDTALDSVFDFFMKWFYV
jgi:hypothetical protein